MRIDLKDFQRETVVGLLRRLRQAKNELSEDGTRQALVLSAPTAAGKTVMTAAVIESVLRGGEWADEAGFEPEPDATFLWLSDKPELNAQSRFRILEVSEALPAERLRIIDPTFDQELLEPATVYFLNFQKLSRDALLVRRGDERQWTIWDTLANTGMQRPGRLYTLIDEAHRGVERTQAETNDATTIAQRFLSGGGTVATVRSSNGEESPFPPIDLVLGISATTQRLDAYLNQTQNRTIRRESVDPARVRASGLIKDRIFIDSPDVPGNPDTLLREACQRLTEMEATWAAYCAANNLQVIVPAMIIQVENSTNAVRPTDTDIGAVVNVLESCFPWLEPRNVVHCFSGFDDFKIRSDFLIRRVDPNDIAFNTEIRVVLFKTALNTGWDCPRAEVMMSFRAADDPTVIAQLVGRMVRTPLARRISSNEMLNGAFLYLPFYSRKELESVVAHLTSDTAETKTEVADPRRMAAYRIQPEFENVLARMRTLPTFSVPGNRPTPDLKRLVRFARLLALEGVNVNALNDAISPLVALLDDERGRLEAADADFAIRIQNHNQVTSTTYAVENGQIAVHDTRQVDLASSDFDAIYRRASGALVAELAAEYVRHRHRNGVDVDKAKLEYVELSSHQVVANRLDERSQQLFDTMRRQNHASIANLGAETRQRFDSILRAGRHPQRAILNIPDTIVLPVPDQAAEYPDHLFLDQDGAGTFRTNFDSSWEESVLAEERAQEGYLGWLRNFDRKPWSLAFVYEASGTWRPGFPDFIIVRRVGEELMFDLMEPHKGEDSAAKAVGLARFVDEDPTAFGRVHLIRVDGYRVRRLAFERRDVRQHVLTAVRSDDALTAAFNRFCP